MDRRTGGTTVLRNNLWQYVTSYQSEKFWGYLTGIVGNVIWLAVKIILIYKRLVINKATFLLRFLYTGTRFKLTKNNLDIHVQNNGTTKYRNFVYLHNHWTWYSIVTNSPKILLNQNQTPYLVCTNYVPVKPTEALDQSDSLFSHSNPDHFYTVSCSC